MVCSVPSCALHLELASVSLLRRIVLNLGLSVMVRHATSGTNVQHLVRGDQVTVGLPQPGFRTLWLKLCERLRGRGALTSMNFHNVGFTTCCPPPPNHGREVRATTASSTVPFQHPNRIPTPRRL